MVGNRTLLGIAGLVWLAAGVNILRIGVKAVIGVITAGGVWRIVLLVLLAESIFCAFHWMFSRIVTKHTARIRGYEAKQPFWRFFDGRSYLLMAFMMSLGIGLRKSGWLPEFFFAFFYTGLGTALTVAGIRFLIRCAKWEVI